MGPGEGTRSRCRGELGAKGETEVMVYGRGCICGHCYIFGFEVGFVGVFVEDRREDGESGMTRSELFRPGKRCCTVLLLFIQLSFGVTEKVTQELPGLGK